MSMGPHVFTGRASSYVYLSVRRDGGLKRAKVKDTFKEEQQKNYSKMIVGNGSPSLDLD